MHVHELISDPKSNTWNIFLQIFFVFLIIPIWFQQMKAPRVSIQWHKTTWGLWVVIHPHFYCSILLGDYDYAGSSSSKHYRSGTESYGKNRHEPVGWLAMLLPLECPDDLFCCLWLSSNWGASYCTVLHLRRQACDKADTWKFPDTAFSWVSGSCCSGDIWKVWEFR